MRSGFLLVDKPKKHTSHDVVARVRKKIGIKKVGHCGTLDPSVTGLLVLAIGREATKLSSFVSDAKKGYLGKGKLGIVTPSQDLETPPVSEIPVEDIELKDLIDSARKFEGSIFQKPPMFSAVKKDGTPLYKLARKGQNIDRKERFIHLYKFLISEYEYPFAWFKVACTKGTYVRSLAHDFGKALGCGGHLSGLRRTVSGKFKVSNATTLEELTTLSSKELTKRIIPILKLSAENK